jgi:hypothetical protein
MAVDIQGVGDIYTDPQVHTIKGKDFGKGNLGIQGMRKFLDSHRCNPVCDFLQLEYHCGKDVPVGRQMFDSNRVSGGGGVEGATVPGIGAWARTHPKLQKREFGHGEYYHDTPHLQEYLKNAQLREAKAKLREDDDATLEKGGFWGFCKCPLL